MPNIKHNATHYTLPTTHCQNNKNSYKIISSSDDQFRVQLSEGSVWLPEFFLLTKRVPLTVTAIDTGAGTYTLPGDGVVVAYVVADREGVVCDDTCEYSFDGVCDESNGGGGGWYSYNTYGGWDDGYTSGMSCRCPVPPLWPLCPCCGVVDAEASCIAHVLTHTPFPHVIPFL